MKGVQGIAFAAVLGVLGALCNWLYLARQAANYERISFVKISSGAQINFGDRFKESDLEELPIPKASVGSLHEVAIRWDQRQTIVGRPATRAFLPEEIILQRDLKTPGAKTFSEMLVEGEVARSIPVDARTFVPDRVNPGDYVSFVIPNFGAGGGNNANNSGQGSSSVHGPYRILGMGTRVGRIEATEAAGKSVGQQHVITIGVQFPLKPEVSQMFETLRLSGNKGVQVMVHSSREAEKLNKGNSR